jgi:hypothetical protein
MLAGRNGHAHRVHFARQGVQARQNRRRKLFGDASRAFGYQVQHTHQFGFFELLVHPRVIPAKITGPNHGNANA